MSGLRPETASTFEPVFWPELDSGSTPFDAAIHEKAIRPTKFDVREGRTRGTFILSEGVDPDLNRRQEEEAVDVASDIASLDARAKRLTAEEEDMKDELVRIAEGSEGQSFRGIRSVPEDFEVQVIPKNSPKVKDPASLRERAGKRFGEIANLVTTIILTLPADKTVDASRIRQTAEREARKAGVARDKAGDTVKVESKVLYDFDKIEELEAKGELRLEEGTIDPDTKWKVTPGRLERVSKNSGKKKAKN